VAGGAGRARSYEASGRRRATAWALYPYRQCSDRPRRADLARNWTPGSATDAGPVGARDRGQSERRAVSRSVTPGRPRDARPWRPRRSRRLSRSGAARGGFPEPALRLQGIARQAWLDSYVEQLITRDAPTLAGSRDPDRLRRYLEALAINSAGIVEDKTLYDAAGINQKTADAYEQLLRNLLILDAVPAWASNRLARLIKTPKRYLVDPSIIAAVLRLDRAALLRDGNLLGRMIDTFVAAQIRPEFAVAQARPRWYHLRDRNGRHEIDLVIEYGGGRVAGIEIKSTAAPRRDDARHLEWLREELGERFVAGVVLHTGPNAFELADKIIAAPISTLWR
jgi:predicted AAA+ superfamily ATPase